MVYQVLCWAVFATGGALAVWSLTRDLKKLWSYYRDALGE